MPTILIIAGPNGAGKTTFANRLFADKSLSLPYLNADEIGREEFKALNGAGRDLAAGRALLERLDQWIKAGDDFALETTLSSLMYARHARRWQQQGYRVTLNYIRLPDVEASIARVARRVSRGGHGIPEADLRRPFGRSLANLEIYKTVVDSWEVWKSDEDGVTLMDRSSP